MEEIREKYIETSPIPVSIKDTEAILNQMKNGICKIYAKNGIKGTGFFCKVENEDKTSYTNLLITNNHILNENDIKIGSTIVFSLNDDKIYKNVKLDENRKVFTDKDTDSTFIEIKPNEDGINYFFELDESVFQDINLLENLYKNSSIYTLHYPKGQKAMVSYGIIKQIENKANIYHLCSTDNGSSGSPILSLDNLKVIGIHYASSKNYNFNQGIMIKYPIIKYNKNKKKDSKIPILDYKGNIKEYISSNTYFSQFLRFKNESIYKYNKYNISNDNFVIKLYSGADYIFLNDYLRERKVNKYTEEEIISWISCLHKSLTKRSNVPNGNIYYRGTRMKFSEELKIGTKLFFRNFISCSPDIKVAEAFAYNGTIFIIKIENNNEPNFYCQDITELSEYPAKEILITFNCIFLITNRKKEKDIEKIYLTCLGYQNN